ncbi:TetR/AcrR family transcriptional regulator [Leifsonia poae]|uniref:TetR family transcriptional regulator n=1 Tax=Leifsonia poae TaxID=110933 RepID=A0A9W6HDT8_9MICO|nr:TetR/AcrR family transcriptional regulator [Leifsonia poae]GLJ78057.1 TetR family transcriptional regulator [Leifsonia poae]
MPTSSRGRPRSEVARRAILTAAREILAEKGYERLTIQEIADRSGTGRQTIYRWWATKALIIADLLLAGELDLPSEAVPDTGSLERDLTSWLEAIAAAMRDPLQASITRALITAASDDPEEARLLYSMTTGPVHQSLVDRISKGKAAGQLRVEVDEIAVADALIGTVLFGALTPGANPAAPGAVVSALVGRS